MYHATSIPSLIADINVKELKDGRIKVVGIGRNPESDEQYKELGHVISKAVIRKYRELAVNTVINELERRYHNIFGLIPATPDDMRAAFVQVKGDVENGSIRLCPKWRALSTNMHALTHFERNTLELLLPYADPGNHMFLSSDRDAIEADMIAICERSNGGNEAAAKEAAHKYLKDADIIYNNMRDKNERLPEIRLSSDAPVVRAPREEQLKALPRALLTQFYSRLAELVETEPYKVFFAVFVIFGLRPAEAAARKPSDLVWYDTFCVAEVSSQEKNGKLDTRLKNEYSRRISIIPYWGKCLLSKCCQVIGANYPQDNQAMNSALECASWVKNLLLEIGISQSFIQDAEKTISTDDFDAGDETVIQKEKIICYVMRRVFATILRTEMGFDLYTTDRLMGHIHLGTSGKERKYDNIDLNSFETQQEIATKMERYIFDPRFSLNPSCNPIDISAEDEIKLIEFSEYCLVNNSDHAVTRYFNFEAAEMGEPISIEMPKCTKHELKSDSTRKSWADRNRNIIGDTTLNGCDKGASNDCQK